MPRGGDERRSTIRDVATRAGVSVATVSRVLAGNYPTAPATRSKVLRAVKELDYVVNAHARALAGVGQKTIAILTREVVTPFYALVIQGAEQQAAQEGRLCLVCTTRTEPDREPAYVKMMCRWPRTVAAADHRPHPGRGTGPHHRRPDGVALRRGPQPRDHPRHPHRGAPLGREES